MPPVVAIKLLSFSKLIHFLKEHALTIEIKYNAFGTFNNKAFNEGESRYSI